MSFIDLSSGFAMPLALRCNLARPPADLAMNLRCAKFDRTDLGNADRLAARCGSFLKYSTETGWQRRAGACWTRVGAHLQLSFAADLTVKSIFDEAVAVEGTAQDVIVRASDGRGHALLSDELRRWALASQSAARLRAMLTMARAQPGFGHHRNSPGG